MSMNGGNVGKVVEALKVNPMTLALIVITAIFMYFVYSGVLANRREINEVMKTLVDRCLPQRSQAELSGPARNAMGIKLAIQVLSNFSPEEVQNRCAKVHGSFFHDGAEYGCNFSKGTVKCTEGKTCLGIPRQYNRPRVAPRYPVQPQYPQQWPQQQWQYYDNRY